MEPPARFNFARDVVERQDPARLALRFCDREGAVEDLTFGQVGDRAARWAGVLRSRGVAPGDRVLVLIGKTPEWHAVMLAALKVGAVAIPCSEMLRAKDLDFRVRHSGAGLLVADPGSQAEVSRDGRVAAGRLRRRGRVGRAGHGHGRHRCRRQRVHPLHLGHDQGPEGRRAHAPLHVGQARAGGALARREAGRPRLVHRRNRLGEVDLERPPRPLELRLGRDPSRGRVRPGRAFPADRLARRDGALPGADRVSADGEARRARPPRRVRCPPHGLGRRAAEPGGDPRLRGGVRAHDPRRLRADREHPARGQLPRRRDPARVDGPAGARLRRAGDRLRRGKRSRSARRATSPCAATRPRCSPATGTRPRRRPPSTAASGTSPATGRCATRTATSGSPDAPTT